MDIKEKVLLIEDDPGIVKFIKATLSANNYDVLAAKTGTAALALASSHCPDLILLDLGLPDMDGADVIGTVRTWSGVPIIVISAREQETEKARILDLGADDYITKPFGTIELMARIRTALRHARTSADSALALTGEYRTGDLVIDYKKHRVYESGRDVMLTPNEFRIVALLGKHAGRVLTYKFIMQELWGPALGSDNKILRVNMANIRRKIEPVPNEPRYIFTEIGVGYRMAEHKQETEGQ